MIRKLVIGIVVVLALLVVGPPLWYRIFSVDPSEPLPPAGTRVVLPSGVGINVLEQGSGPTVLLVHGLPGTAYDWRELSRELAARGYRALAIDRSGYGHSDPSPQGDYSLRRNAAEVSDLMDVMDLRDVILVGWSYGGATAAVVAEQRPERLSHLVLMGTGGPSGPDDTGPESNAVMELLYSQPVLRWRSTVPPIGRGLIQVLSVQAFSEQSMPEWWIPTVVANFQRWDTLMTYRGEMFGFEVDESFDYRDIELPTLLLHGDDDRLAPIEISRYLVTLIPGAQLGETPGGSHMLPVTHAPEMADQIAAFAPLPAEDEAAAEEEPEGEATADAG